MAIIRLIGSTSLFGLIISVLVGCDSSSVGNQSSTTSLESSVPKKRTLTCTLYNFEPYTIYYILHYPVDESTAVTEGWWSLKPGERRKVSFDFPASIEPKLYVHAHSNFEEAELIKWLWGLPYNHEGRIYYEGGKNANVTFQNITFEAMNHSVPQGSKYNTEFGMELAAFCEVSLNSETDCEGIYVFRNSEKFPGIFDTNNLTDGTYLDVFAERAALLNAVLTRQMSYEENFPNPTSEFPYYVGLGLNDHNGMDFPGILINAVDAETTIFGDEIPFQEGDIITHFNGYPVFHPSDLYMLLYEHAQDRNRGIKVPVNLRVVRENSLFAIESSYFFNPSYWPSEEYGKAKAFAAGVENTIGLGDTGGALGEVLVRNAGRAIWNFIEWSAIEGDVHEDMEPKEYLDVKEETWETIQTHARYRQMYPDAFDIGTWGGFVTPSAPRLLFAKTLGRGIAKKGISRGIAKVMSSVTLEVVEGIIWTVGTSSPLRSNEDIFSEIIEVMPYSAAGGFVSGLPFRKTP